MIKRARLDEVNLIVGPLIAVQGGKWKGYRMDGEREPDGVSAAKTPALVESTFADHGFVIRDEPAAPAGANPPEDPGEAG